MRIAFWGLGSIAKRHIRNVYELLSERGNVPQIDIFRHENRKIEEEDINSIVSNIYLSDQLKDSYYDVIFITNPTSQHFETIKKCVPHTDHIFIEKPVFENCHENVQELGLKDRSVYYVACPLRWTSVIQYIKKNIDLSKVFSVRAVSSSYLPDWRPGTDYRKTALYRCYDITSLLKPGKKNAIGAQVSSGWFMGDVSKGEYGVHELGFIAKMVISYDNGTSETIVTDPTWLSSFDGPVRLGEIYHGEVYDARKEADWTQPAYNDSRWNQTSVNPYFKGVLKSFCGPTVQVRPQLERQPQSITVYSGATDRKINVVRTVDGPQAIRLYRTCTCLSYM